MDIMIMHSTFHPEPLMGIQINSARMPLRMDNAAFSIFTPGLGCIIDLRDRGNFNNWSVIYGGHINLSCYANLMAGIGAGVRKKIRLNDNFTFDLSFMLEAIIMTRYFLPTYNFNPKLRNLAYNIMHDLPGSNHKIIFPSPMVQISFKYLLDLEKSFNFDIIWCGASIGMFFGMTIPIDNIVKKLKIANIAKRRIF